MLKTFLIYKEQIIKKMSWSSNDNNSPWGKKPKGNGKVLLKTLVIIVMATIISKVLSR